MRYAIIIYLLLMGLCLAHPHYPGPNNLIIPRNVTSIPAWEGNNYEVILGEYYWLPDGFYEPAYGSWVCNGTIAPQEVETMWVRWDDVETAPGVYDFSYITNRLDLEHSQGDKLEVGMVSCHPDYVPLFYLSLITPTTLPSTGMAITPSWDAALSVPYNNMIEALGAEIVDHPAFNSMYIRAVGNSLGEEFILEPSSDINYLESFYGVTSDTYLSWLSGRMDAYATAFAGSEYKIAWVGNQGDVWPWAPEDYRTMVDSLVTYAWDLGFGNRSGIIEAFNIHLKTPAFGGSVDSLGYLHVDETIPPIAEGRLFADENEEYNDYQELNSLWVSRYGPYTENAHRYRFSNLAALQKRLNHMWSGSYTPQINLALHNYVGYELGQTVLTTPDVSCYLRSTPVGTYFSASGDLKNFERWLIQRDVDDGVTVPSHWVDRSFNAGYESVPYGDYTARRTNVATNDSCIYFQADEDFAVTDSLKIAVEVYDKLFTSWRVKYVDSISEEVTYTDAYVSEGDGLTRTIIFTINGYVTRGLSNGYDFCIVVSPGYPDVHVKWVRVIRVDPTVVSDEAGPVMAAADSSYNDTLDRAIAELTSDEPCTLTYRVRENQDAYGTPVVGDTLNTAFELQHDASGLSEGDVVTFQMAGTDTIGNVSADSLEITVSVPADTSGGGGEYDVTTGYVWISGNTDATQVKMLIYDGSLNLVAESPATNIAGTGQYTEVTLSSAYTVTPGSAYFCGVITDGTLAVGVNTGAGYATRHDASGTFASPPDPYTAAYKNSATMCAYWTNDSDVTLFGYDDAQNASLSQVANDVYATIGTTGWTIE